MARTVGHVQDVRVVNGLPDANGNVIEDMPGGSGGGGGAATIADGADVAQGTTTDAASVAGGAGTTEAKLRLMTTQLAAMQASLADIETASEATGDVPVAGGIAHDAAYTANPVPVGGKAVAALSGVTRVAAGDLSNNYTDLDGAALVRMYGAIGDKISGTVTNTDGARVACIAAQGAGLSIAVTHISLFNSSAGGITVNIDDDTTTKMVCYLPATGGVSLTLPSPLIGTANKAWQIDASGATTTIYANMVGYLVKTA